ncbi:MAG: phosphoglycerate dehydrogenase [Vicinamibacterales bacterium]
MTVIAPPVIQQLGVRELLGMVGEIDGMIAGDDELTREVLLEAPRLRIISKWGIGTDSIDLSAAAELGIRVTNTPGMFGDEVADVVIGYLVLLARKLNEIDRNVRAGQWTKPVGVSLGGRTIAVIGLGDIGMAVCRRALTMGLRVVGTDVDPAPTSRAAEMGVEVLDLDRALAEADVVSLNCPLTSRNRHMLDGRRLGRLRKGAWIINTARGGLISETALAERLANGTVGAAALDVFETEPLPMDSPLRSAPNMILGSHNSSNTIEASLRTSERAIENLFIGLDEVRR